ncbi:MAG TPA: AsnC family transcriptional regulator [Pseudonocardia sp.]|nr:AsnC family transcriptional regulator [Pseudonocardia sp.]
MLDQLDRGLIHALQLDGRATYTRIGAALDVSTQTVARRYRRLRGEAGLRVVGLPEPGRAGRAQWLVRLTASPHTAQDLARALARRADTSWVKLASGGTEIVAVVLTAASGTSAHSLLLQDIPRTASITALSAHYLLHTYLGGPTAWQGRTAVLDARQQRVVTDHPRQVDRGRGALADADSDLLAALGRDGRTSLTDLAEATGWSAVTVARRLDELQASGAIFFDLEISAALLGAGTQAVLWMAVEPAHLDKVGTALAGHPELAFVAATTGATNLVAHALCEDPAALHHYLTHRLASLPAIRALETAPVLRTVKAAGPLNPAGRA